MIPIKNETPLSDLEYYKKAAHKINFICDTHNGLIKENPEIWKGILTLKNWIHKVIESEDNAAALQIRCYADSLLEETAKEIEARGKDEQRIEEESPRLAENKIEQKSVKYFEVYKELNSLREQLAKHFLTMKSAGDGIHSIPMSA